MKIDDSILADLEPKLQRVPRKMTVGIFGDSRSFRRHIEVSGCGVGRNKERWEEIGKFEKEEIEIRGKYYKRKKRE